MIQKIILISIALAVAACNNPEENKSSESPSTDSPSAPGASPELAPASGYEAAPQQQEPAPSPAPAPVQQQAGSAGAVQHYICPNKDGGGGDAAGKCPKCGAELAHNDEFHKNDAAPQITPSPVQQPQIQMQPPQPATNPGVPHYTCPNNDGGGGEAAGKCPKCGTEMVHNDKYHQ